MRKACFHVKGDWGWSSIHVLINGSRAVALNLLNAASLQYSIWYWVCGDSEKWHRAPLWALPPGRAISGSYLLLTSLNECLSAFLFLFFFLSLFFFQANQSFADPGDLPDTVREWLAEFKPNAEGHGGEIKTRMPKFKKPSWKSTTRSWKVEFALYYVQTIFSFYYIKYILLMIKTECICRLCTFSFFSNELLLLNCF